ncbi:phosphoribosylanthranilate isomerase [Staphylococcus sp. 17KM0847]|uniref:phosphoribosylanthranilate isomerase n=1 Tax=Staphylococcus sp. 17KM0847 TaxID=2583989 RepID=UPI0015DBF891|nr:phosphoribosylanthranilate isomerase [Staphylococcus sp. 17KM0847]QLK86782.1 phosphoribosylanthranilate isomerase [Staphylococcus sp. 17KM0847]
MYIKYCGFTRQQDVEAACTCPINAIGFVMYPKSERYAEMSTVQKLAAYVPEYIDRVAVVVNMPLSRVSHLLYHTAVNTLQLHGDESVAYIQSLRLKHPGVKIIKALRADDYIVRQIRQYIDYVDVLLIDTPSQHYGGAGTPFDWNLLADISMEKMIIAGGLNDETLPKLMCYLPKVWGVDIASGIEDKEKGQKSYKKMLQMSQYLRGDL